MRGKLGLATLVTIVLTIMVASTAPAANAQQCSLAAAAGSYGFTGNGVLLTPSGAVPIAAVGRINLRADGTVTGTEARSVGGDFANEALTGTWTINSNCWGTLTAQVFQSGKLVRTSVLSFVADANMTEIRNVQKSLTLPDGTKVPTVITFEGKRTF